MMNKAIHNTLSSRGNEGSSGIEMFRQAQHDKQPCHPERSEGSQQTIKTKKMMNKAIHNTLSSRGNEGSQQTVKTKKMMNKTIHTTQVPQGKTPLSFGEGLGVRLLLLTTFFCSLFSIPGSAQNYEWDWAINGGSNLGDNTWRYDAEQVYDIVVGSDDNYYFLASMNGKASNTPSGSQLAGQPVTEYNQHIGGSIDIFLFSTTCDGTVRWSQAIGGGGADRAYKIALDSNNNVYVGANVQRGRKVELTEYQVHFSPTEALPMPPSNQNTISDAWKTSFLVKYNSNGQFEWKKALQGDVNGINYDSGVLDILIDSKDIVHFIVGFEDGVHLDNNVTVPAPVIIYQYYLAKYDTAGNYVSSMALPITDGTGFVPPSFTFKLDEASNRYYIAGFRSYINANENIPLTYAGTAFTQNAYMLAIDADNGSEIWRREMEIDKQNSFDDCRIYDLEVDNANGDIYIGGKLSRGTSNTFVKIIDPKNSANNPYDFVFDLAGGNVPFIAKLDKDGAVQWARTPSGYTWSGAYTGSYFGSNVALRGGEVAFATNGTNTIWDGFSMNYPSGHKSDPLLMRFSKQTGNVVGMHHIEGSAGEHHLMTAVAVDNDGNYVVGGSYYGNLFTDRGVTNQLGYIGKYDFFAAKLAASVCGTAVSTEEFNRLQLNVYPNPTTDIVNIETDEQLSNYIIYDVSGRQIQSNLFAGSNQINLQNVTTGVYFIKVTTVQGSSATVRVVKQ